MDFQNGQPGSLWLKTIVFFFLFVALGLQTPAEAFLRVGYIETRYPSGTDWHRFEQIYNGSYSHIIAAFWRPVLKPNSRSPVDVDIVEVGAALQILEAKLPDNATGIVSRARANNVKIMVSIGGSSVPFKAYITISLSTNLKSRFIARILEKLADYDGMDLNWEGMKGSLLSKTDRTFVELLAKDLARAVKRKYPEKIVSVTLPPLHWLPMGFTCDFINSGEVDFASHMSYDFYTEDNYRDKPIGPFRNREKAWLYNNGSDPCPQIENSVWGALHYLREQGCNMRKVLGGIPFYASDRIRMWNDVRNDDWNYFHDHPSFPYLEKSNTADETKGLWINDPQAIERKIVEYKNLGLGGVMVWQIGQEGPAADLTEAIRDAVSRGNDGSHAP